MPDLAKNKANVIAFYELMFNDCRPREAIEQYAGADYIQHNPHVATGKDGFIAYFERMAREWPGTVKTTFAERFGTISAANLRRAHELIESGRAKGKVVLEGWS